MSKREEKSFSAFVMVNGKIINSDQDTCHECGAHEFNEKGFCRECGKENCLKCGFLGKDCKCELARREIKLKDSSGEEKVAMIADFSGFTKAWNNIERDLKKKYQKRSDE